MQVINGPSLVRKRGKWVAKFSYIEDGDPKVRTRTHQIGVADPSVESRALAIVAMKEWFAGTTREMQSRRQLLSHDVPIHRWCERYATDKFEMGLISGSTYAEYRMHCRRMKSYFEDRSFIEITEADVYGMISWARPQGIGSTSLKKLVKFLKSCSNAAYLRSHGEMAFDPCALVETPAAPSRRINAMASQEVRRTCELLSAWQDDLLRIAGLWLINSGMRPGELLALRLGSVHRDRGLIIIDEAIGRDENGRWRLKETKTGNRRVIPLTRNLEELYNQSLLRLSQLSGVPVDELDPGLFLLGTPDGRHATQTMVAKRWTAFARGYNITGSSGEYVTLYDLRHTFATMWVARGGDISALAEIMGHSSTKMTLDIYAEASPESKRRGMDSIADMLDRGMPPV